MDTVQIITDLIKQFGFPIAVAGWALWRLDRSWGKGENIQSRLDQIDEGLDRIELAMNKQAEIQQEMLLTIRLINTLITANNNNGGGRR
jgi:site-specific recombinase